MSLLDKKYLSFDEGDVKLMQDMMKKFYEFHKNSEMPDYSSSYVGYLPVFTIALLSSQDSIDRLTKELVWLSRLMAFLTFVLVLLTFVLLKKAM
jgi:hypothetical protein